MKVRVPNEKRLIKTETIRGTKLKHYEVLSWLYKDAGEPITSENVFAYQKRFNERKQ